MLLISAPVLIDASLSRAFLEDAQRLAAEVARALHAHRRGTAGDAERTRLDAAVQQMRKTSTPLLAILNPEQRVAVTDDPALPDTSERAT